MNKLMLLLLAAALAVPAVSFAQGANSAPPPGAGDMKKDDKDMKGEGKEHKAHHPMGKKKGEDMGEHKGEHKGHHLGKKKGEMKDKDDKGGDMKGGEEKKGQ